MLTIHTRGGGREEGDVLTLHAATDEPRLETSRKEREREKKVYFALSWHRQCARRKRRRARRRVYTYTRDEEETVNHGREEIERERE